MTLRTPTGAAASPPSSAGGPMLAIDSERERNLIEMIPHTADLRLRVSADSVEELFRESLRGLMSCLQAQGDETSARILGPVEITSADRTALLVDFLNEALTLAILNREMYGDVRFDQLGETSLTASLAGTPARFGEDIKAVTYHEAEIVRDERGTWSTLLVLDI